MTDLAARAAAFAREHIAARDGLERLDTMPPDLWRALGDAGLLGAAIDPAFGGGGHDGAAQAAAGEALVRHGLNLGVATCWNAHLRQSDWIVQRLGTDAQKAALLPAMARGTLTPCIAISEPGVGAHPKRLATEARRDGGDWVLTGEKAWLTNGPLAGMFFVLAVTAVEDGRKRFSCLIVPREAKGVSFTEAGRLDWLKPAAHCGLRLDGVRVPADALLGPEGRAWETIAGPLRDHEDRANLCLRFGGLMALLDALAERLDGDDAAETLGALAVEIECLRALAAALPERGEAAERLLLGLRAALRAATTRAAALLPPADGSPRAAKVATLARDLDKIAGVARYVERIRLARIGEGLLKRL